MTSRGHSSSTPVRNTIGNGQHGLLIALCLVGYIEQRHFAARAAFLALAATKYSIGGFAWAYALGRRDWPSAIGSAAITAASFLLLAWITGARLDSDLFLSPLRVNMSGMAVYEPFSTFRRLFGAHAPFTIAIGGLGVAFLLGRRSLRSDRRDQDGAMTAALAIALTSLVFAPHAGYDACVLIVAFVFGHVLRGMPRWMATLATVVLLYHWNFAKLASLILSPADASAFGVVIWSATGALAIALLFWPPHADEQD